MTVTQLGQLTIFHLDDIEWEDAELKNRCLIQAETPYIVYVLNSVVENQELLNTLENNMEYDQNGGENHLLAFILGEAPAAELDYAGTFRLISKSIVVLLFSKGLIRRTGAFNQKLITETNFELLCRIARETNLCEVIGIEKELEKNALTVSEKEADTFAYMIRNHMNDLHTLGLTNQIFSLFCEYTQSKDIFPLFQRKVNLFLSDERAYEQIARQTAPFVILRGNDICGGVLREFADDLADSLISNCQTVIMIDDDFTQHEKLQNMVCKGVVGFQNKALEIDFFQKIRGRKFQFWFDNPLHFENVLRNLPDEYFVLCQDANYATLIREYYHTKNAIQFPPGGKNRCRISQKQEYKSLPCVQRDRPYDIVFVGTFFEETAGGFVGFEKEFYDYMLLHPCDTFEQGLSELLKMKKEEGQSSEEQSIQERGTDAENFIRLSHSLKSACRMVIGHYRNAVIATILEAGFTLHVYGDSWERYAGAGRENLRIHPYVTMDESLEELEKAKIGLNIMSWHKAGMTERIANIMISGAVCLTEETDYVRQHMQEGEEIVSFRLDRLEKLPEKISELLKRPDLREKIAGKAYRKATAEYIWERRAEELIALSESAEGSTLTVFVATHVKCDPPHDPIYVPLHVGRYGKKDLGYLGDDTGENISDLNFLYGELTGLFWIWQNVYDMDYVGLCHYRRYFLNSKRQAMGKSDYVRLLEQYDAIVPKHAECEESYYKHFGKAHNKHDLDAVERALKRIYPKYADAYDKVMEGSIYYGGNLVVTSLPILKAYAEWLFNIFMEASGEIDVSGYDDYHKRVYGFLSEQMFYVFALANGLNCCEAVVGISEEKAETKALKENLKKLLQENKLEEARRLFDARLKIRPDLLLPGSDINGELQAVYRRLLN